MEQNLPAVSRLLRIAADVLQRDCSSFRKAGIQSLR
jgi:hypothetical protein